MQLTIVKAVASAAVLLIPGVMALPAGPFGDLGNLLGGGGGLPFASALQTGTDHLRYTAPTGQSGTAAKEGPYDGAREVHRQAHVAIDNGMNPADAPSHGSPVLDGILGAIAPAQAGKPDQ